MAEVFYFHVQEDRSIKYKLPEPIMQEDKDVATWRFRIPKVLNNIDMSAWAWWFVYVNAKGQKFSELLTLGNDIDDPDNYCTADYPIGYGISKTPGGFTFALEAINAEQGGEISGEWHTRTYTHTVTPTLQGNQAEYTETESDIISALIQQIQQKYNALVGGATPLVVSSVSAMTDTSKIYVLSTEGNWYYHNGTAWVSGGTYASGITIDPTLSQSGQAADAKETGNKISKVMSGLGKTVSVLPDEVKRITEVDDPLLAIIGNCNGSGVIDTTNTARLHTDYIEIEDYAKFGFSSEYSNNRQYWVRCFSDKKQEAFIGSANSSAASDAEITREQILNDVPNTKYVVFAIKKTSDGAFSEEESCLVGSRLEKEIDATVSLDNVYVSKYKKAYYSDDIHLQYSIDNDGHYTKGWLKLPPNYSASGTPVPLIVFVHGSSDFGNIDAPITNLYQDYYNYLKNCGYAIFDCYGWGSVYTAQTGGFTNTWGVKTNRKCYRSGIRYVVDNYNIDQANIFVSAKSLGGVQALSMLYDESIPIVGGGLLAPLLNPMQVYLGYDVTTRHCVTSEMGFSEDINNVLNFSETPTQGFWDYLTDNIQNWSGVINYFSGLDIKTSEKPNYYQNKTAFMNLSRVSLNRNIKIWIAEDDGDLITLATAFINSLNNYGYKGILRTLPANTGGHHAVDNSPLALQATDVTTRLGVHYESIPLAYYELAEFFDGIYTR